MNDIAFLLDSPIAYHRVFAKVANSVTAGVFLSQAVYWSRRATLEGGWFYKSSPEWEEETVLSKREQETARRKLREIGVLEEKLDNPNGNLWKHIVFYRINYQKLAELLQTLAVAECTNPPYRSTPHPEEGSSPDATQSHSSSPEVSKKVVNPCNSRSHKFALSSAPNSPIECTNQAIRSDGMRTFTGTEITAEDTALNPPTPLPVPPSPEPEAGGLPQALPFPEAHSVLSPPLQSEAAIAAKLSPASGPIGPRTDEENRRSHPVAPSGAEKPAQSGFSADFLPMGKEAVLSRLSAVFGRSLTATPTSKELELFDALPTVSPSDLDLIAVWYRLPESPTRRLYRPQSLVALLRSWQKALDRARQHVASEPSAKPSVSPVPVLPVDRCILNQLPHLKPGSAVTARVIFDALKRQMQSLSSEATVKRWFEDLSPLGLRDPDEALIINSSRFAAEFISENFKTQIRSAVPDRNILFFAASKEGLSQVDS